MPRCTIPARYWKSQPARKVRGFVFLSVACWLTLVSNACNAESHAGAGYPPPDISRFILTGEEDGDGDGDGINETHIRHYRDIPGDRVFSMTTNNHLWAWSLQSSASGTMDPKHNFVIRDSDCDGTFDEKYGLDEQFHVPECVDH
ncbi:MAG: hypothetical protein H6954_08420 [Chromatiaceae bacterium]|nr:hypothetical protein [Chromatiaceae bacterium]